MMGQPDAPLAQKYGVTAIGQMTKTNSDHLSRLTHYVEDLNVRPTIGGSYPLDEVKQASTLAEGHVRGKVVITIS